ncbi:hypothetical protein AB4874_10745 [Thioclava sp. 15-R06ZXC-3]|uniref:Uncharacterized protein n=1 Tax=Thioclava arctica TaxID=3238301 RepID=A0ABV3TKN4_9RHOB
MLIWLRGTGKNVPLNRIAKDEGFLALRIEDPEKDDFARQFTIAAKTALLRLSNVEKAKSLAIRGLRGVASFIATLKFSHGDVSVSVDPLPGYADTQHKGISRRCRLSAVGKFRGWQKLDRTAAIGVLTGNGSDAG